MPYNSPFQMLGLDISSEINRSTLNLARRKVFAEIDLSTTQTLMRGDKELTKDDVIRLFDSLEKLQNLEYHRLIAKDDALRYFLETNSVKRERRSKKNRYILETFAEEPMYQDPDFIAFISPYYTESWSITVLEYIKKQDQKTLKDIFEKLPKLMTHEAEISAWAKIEDYLEQRLKEISENIENKRYTILIKSSEVHDASFVYCINLLPISFASFRDAFGLQFHNLAVAIINTQTRYIQFQDARSVINQAMIIECSIEIKNKIKDTQQQINNKAIQQTLIDSEKYKNPRSEGIENMNSTLITFFIFLFILFIKFIISAAIHKH